MPKTALIVGAGSGISASVARALHREGYQVALAARNVGKLDALAGAVNAKTYACDVKDAGQVAAMFGTLDADFGTLDVVLYNPSARVRGPIGELKPADVKNAIDVTAFGGFLVAQQAAHRMVAQGSGAILFTGASASIKGYAQSAAFAMGKFALRGLAQSMARELAPKGIHVAHFIIDGGVQNAERGRFEREGAGPDSMLHPDAIAETYLHVLGQPRTAWTWEVALRPWVEKF
jgi:NAD(P)-dependent dehydrogenase (short-subunit alcohol dehydrogenase family)